MKCAHKVVPLRYLAAHDDARRRMAKGERQVKCPACGLYIWASHYRTAASTKERT